MAKLKFGVGQRVLWVRKADYPIQCPLCNGGGLIYHEGPDNRTKCGRCKGAGTIDGQRAWVERKRIHRLCEIDGEIHYVVWDGEHETYIPEDELTSSPKAASERFQELHGKEKVATP